MNKFRGGMKTFANGNRPKRHAQEDNRTAGNSRPSHSNSAGNDFRYLGTEPSGLGGQPVSKARPKPRSSGGSSFRYEKPTKRLRKEDSR